MARRLGVSRDDVIDAAVHLSDEQGLRDLTVAAVADAVGCRPPSVYHHVDGLAGLSRAVALHATLDLNSTLEDALRDRDGVEACRALVDAAVGWARAHPYRVEALRYHDGVDDPALTTARGGTALLFQDAVARLGVPPEDRPPLVALLRAMLRGVAEDPDDVALHGGGDLAAAQAAGNRLLVDLTLDHLADVTRRAGAR